MADENVKRTLEGAGALAILSAPAELRKLIESEVANFRAAAQKAGHQPK